MNQEFVLLLRKDTSKITRLQSKVSKNEYGVYKSEKYFLKSCTINGRLGFHDKKAPENSNRRFVLPQSNSLLSFQNNFIAKFWIRTFAPTISLKFFCALIVSMNGDTRNFWTVKK